MTNYDILKEYEAHKTPVPSYEEWKAKLEENETLKSKLQLKETAYDFDTARLEEQNAQLKELLKECKNILEEQTFFRNTILETDETLRTRIIKKAEILTKIDEALK